MRKKLLTLALILLPCIALANIANQQAVKTFIQDMAKKEGFSTSELRRIFKQVSINKKIIKAMNTPYEAKPWYLYEKRFIQRNRIQDGVDYWNKNEDVLARAEKEYHVPASIIVAIIGVESHYGKNTGGFRVIDALSTLAFAYPRRAKFFKRELSEFLIMTRENKLDPFEVYGSYAGAIGQPQFMPSSYRHYAVDFAGDGKADLQNNTLDVIGSVANYFHVHGWKYNQPIIEDANITSTLYQKLKTKNSKPKKSLNDLLLAGVKPKKHYPKNLPATVLRLETSKNKYSYYVSFTNFYVITRYNTSPLYAMAVTLLAEQIEEAKKASNS